MLLGWSENIATDNRHPFGNQASVSPASETPRPLALRSHCLNKVALPLSRMGGI